MGLLDQWSKATGELASVLVVLEKALRSAHLDGQADKLLEAVNDLVKAAGSVTVANNTLHEIHGEDDIVAMFAKVVKHNNGTPQSRNGN